MTITTFNLMRLCVGLLKAPSNPADPTTGATDAGQRVYTPGDWPTWDQQYPYIRARVQSEDKESLGRSAPRFTVTGVVQFALYVAGDAQPDDAEAALLDEQLQALARQIDVALINHPLLMASVQQFPFVRSRDVYDASGARHYGALELLLGVEFYQETDDFYAYPVADIERITLDLDLVNIFDPEGVYADPPFPAAVLPAPRGEGPDGRAEGGFDLLLGQADFSNPDQSGLLPAL